MRAHRQVLLLFSGRRRLLNQGVRAVVRGLSHTAARTTLETVVAPQLKLNCLADWYHVTRTAQRGLSPHAQTQLTQLLDHYDGSLIKALSAAYPEHVWRPWSFRHHRAWKREPLIIQQLIECVAEQLGIQDKRDWYSVQLKALKSSPDGRRLFALVRGKLPEFLKRAYSDHPWEPDLFKSSRKRLHSESAQRGFFERLALQKGMRLEDLSLLHIKQLDEAGGAFVRKKYSGNVSRALKTLFPHVSFVPRRINQRRSRGFLDNVELVKHDVELLGKRLGIVQLDDWYLTPFSRIAMEDQYILGKYGSLAEMLATAYPEHDWFPWRFTHTPRRWWNDIKNRQKFMKWLCSRYEMNTESNPHAWFRTDYKARMAENGAKVLARKYNSPEKLLVLLKETWPNVEFELEDRGRHSHSWRSAEAQRQFFRSILATQGKTVDLESHYKLSYSLVSLSGGAGLLSQYGGSLLKALQSLYPDHIWMPWKFQPVPRKFWESREHQKAFLDWCAVQLGVSSPQDWNNVSAADIARLGGRSMLVGQFDGSLTRALSQIYGISNTV